MERITLKIIFLLSSIFCFITTPDNLLYSQPLQWQVLGRLSEARQLFKALPINKDSVLVIGGYGYGNSAGQPTKSCEYINVNSRSVKPAPGMNIQRAEFVALTTSDSNIIVIGGATTTSYNVTPTIEIYDRNTKSWSLIGNLITPRFQHNALFINTTEILVVGGRRQDLSSIAQAEIFNISTGQSRNVAPFPYSMNYPNIALTSNNKLIVFGGRAGGQGSFRSPGVFEYNYTLNRWDSIGIIPVNVYHPECLKLWQGRLFASGGSANELPNDFRDVTFIENNGTFSQTNNLQSIRVWHSVAQYSTDSVLSCGGQLNNLNGQKNCDWYIPTTGQTSIAPQLNTAHFNSQLVSIPTTFNGSGLPTKSKVVFISGMTSPSTSTDTIEILAPVVQGCQSLDSVEKIINWNFDQGVSGFQTDYPVTSYNTSVEQCTVTTSVRGFNNQWSQCQDHTGSNGNGYMLVVNGATAQDQFFWKQNITIKPFTLYKLSLWVTAVHPDNPPRLRFYFNGVPDTTTFKPTGQTCVWQLYQTEWRSGASTNLQLSIKEEERQFQGNDFAVDDVSMKECVCRTTVKINNNDSIFCKGDSLLIGAPSGYADYLWSNGAKTASIFVNDSGKYFVTVVDSSGCTGKDSIKVTFYPQPKAKITGKSIVCIGDSTVLTTQFDSTYIYQWYKGNTKTKIPSAVKNSYITKDSGMYYVQVKNAYGCIIFDSIHIRFNPKPNPKIQQSRPFFCIGDTLVLTVNNNYFQYKWSNGTTGSKTVIKDSGLYVITVVDSLGCIGTDSIRVKGVLPISPTINSSKTILCDNDTAKLEANQGFSAYHWSTGQNTRSIIVRGPGTYYVYAIDINGCTGRDSMVLSYPPPPPGLNLTATKQAICFGDTAVLTVSPGYKSYEWSNGMNTSKITVTEPGNYYVYVRDSNGCRYSLAMYVGNSKFRITGYPKVACQGDVIILKCPGSYTNFLWNTGERTREIKVTTSGTYKVTVLDLDSKCNSDSVTIEFLPKPQAKILTSRTSFCGGDTIILRRAKGTGEAYWYPTGAEVTDTLLVRATGTYILGVKSSNGCWSYDTVQIKNTPPPTCSITANKQFLCERDSLLLQATSGFHRYKWSSGDTTSFITVTKEGTYYVTVYTEEGCYTTAEYNVYLRLAPNVNITSNKAQICTGDTAILIASADIKDVSYEWSTGEKGSIIKVTSPGVYVVKAIYTNGCSSMARVTLVSNVSKPISITSSHKVICGDNSATLTATQGFKEYLWNTGSTQQSITINESGVYTVEAKDSNNCVSISQFAIKKVPLPSPLIQSTEQTWCKGDAIALSSSQLFAAYYWSTGETSRSITVKDTGIYTLSVIDTNGCSSGVMEFHLKAARPELQILSNTRDSILTTGINAFICDSVILFNPSNISIVLTYKDIQLLVNQQLSLPQGQLPITVLPHSKAPVHICIAPKKEETILDTLILWGTTRCPDKLPVIGKGIPFVLHGNDFCTLPLEGVLVKDTSFQLRIAPNPVQEKLIYALVGSEKCQITSVIIHSVTGTKWQPSCLEFNSVSGVIDTHSLSTGMYMLSVQVGEKFYQQIFTIVK